MKEFSINKYLSVRFEHGETHLYVAGQHFIQCKHLLLNIASADMSEVESIDEAAEKTEYKNLIKIDISPEVEFWGHCSNLQAWYENGYDTRLIHSNLAFPLLGKLSEVGDPHAREIFKKEIFKRYENGNQNARKFIQNGGALKFLSIEERLNLLLNIKDLIILTELVEDVWVNREPYEVIDLLINQGIVIVENKSVKEIYFSGIGRISQSNFKIKKLEDFRFKW
ncbi:MAG: hypothetical protein ACFFE4_21550 [Candidatus Thorarchaeota archaeon]